MKEGRMPGRKEACKRNDGKKKGSKEARKRKIEKKEITTDKKISTIM